MGLQLELRRTSNTNTWSIHIQYSLRHKYATGFLLPDRQAGVRGKHGRPCGIIMPIAASQEPEL